MRSKGESRHDTHPGAGARGLSLARARALAKLSLPLSLPLSPALSLSLSRAACSQPLLSLSWEDETYGTLGAILSHSHFRGERDAFWKWSLNRLGVSIRERERESERHVTLGFFGAQPRALRESGGGLRDEEMGLARREQSRKLALIRKACMS